jgi:two-component system, NtrC family, response regulator HydG
MMRASLTIERGEGVPPVLELDPKTAVTLGRSRDNTLVLHDEHASRQHAQIFFQEGQWLIRDFGALNGTRLDGKPIQQQAVLQHGQEIGIAEMRLRFTLQGTPAPTLLAGPAAAIPRGVGILPALGDEDTTALQADDLAVLYDFMKGSAEETDQQALVRSLLEIIALKTRAGVVGFLSFDPDNPLPKMVLPEVAKVDIALSRRLNQRARQEGRTVRLPQGDNDADRSESLMPFQDALCVPLKADGAPLGALHVYRSGKLLSQREVNFCEVAGGHAAHRLARLRELRSLTAENSRLREHSAASSILVGDGPAMRRLRDLIGRAASCDAAVLIHGETGAGKEPVALALHAQSARARGPIVVSNCGAIMPTLLESELFGHVKGAFTGALNDHQGLFEQADDGTLFLDEIGDMSLECQVKLLRVIEGKPFQPVGGTRRIQTDVRVVAATHKNLEQEVRAGRFRQDLYYRLVVVYLRVPPLREHPEDIPALAAHFLERLAAGNRQRQKKLSPAALRRLQEFSWPGNVRQLRAVLESAMVMCDGDTIEEGNLWLAGASHPDQPLTLNLEALTEWAVRRALARTEGNLVRAAELLGISRETVRNMKRKYQIDDSDP